MIKLLAFAVGVFVGRSTLWPAVHKRDERIGDQNALISQYTHGTRR